MGLFSFMKDAGERLFGTKEVEAAAPVPAAAEAPKPSLAELNQKAADAIRAYMEKQNLGLSELAVAFDATTATVTLKGSAPSQEAAEKAALAAGNVANVSSVDNRLSVPDSAPESQYHDVVRGDTLSAIAKKYYGNANKYNIIFEANRPMLSDPNRIYPGQKLRIPPLP